MAELRQRAAELDLSVDPDNGTIMQWEAMYPVPAPEAATYRTDPRIDVADKRITLGYRVTPDKNGFAHQMAIFESLSRRYRNALRELSK